MGRYCECGVKAVGTEFVGCTCDLSGFTDADTNPPQDGVYLTRYCSSGGDAAHIPLNFKKNGYKAWNWGGEEYSYDWENCGYDEGVVTHWMPLPEVMYMKWIYVDQSMPPENEYVLVAYDVPDGGIGIARYMDGEWDNGSTGRRLSFTKKNKVRTSVSPQYWLPLPEVGE